MLPFYSRVYCGVLFVLLWSAPGCLLHNLAGQDISACLSRPWSYRRQHHAYPFFTYNSVHILCNYQTRRDARPHRTRSALSSIEQPHTANYFLLSKPVINTPFPHQSFHPKHTMLERTYPLCIYSSSIYTNSGTSTS